MSGSTYWAPSPASSKPVRSRCTALAFALAALPLPAAAQQAQCDGDSCRVRLTAAQLLSSAERLVSEHRFGEAAPMLAALENAPELALQRQFLIGYAAIESGDLEGGIKVFRSLLDRHPQQTRVRLELARALMLKGKAGAADHHFRLAQTDSAIPPEIAATIRASRRLLADSRAFAFNLDVGIAPDSNITNGTSADTVDIAFGNQTVPLTLDAQARERGGVGQTMGFAGSARLGLGEETRLLIEADSQIVNYKGEASDDIAAQFAVGPEFALGDTTRLSVQALATQRWYGGDLAQRAGGIRATLRREIGEHSRLGISLDARRSQSLVSSAYSGWQLAGSASFERVIARSMIASASLFARRDLLTSDSYSSREFGANLGLGGELPLGISAGLSGGVARAAYDAPLALFGSDPRKDWRFNARAQLGLRSLRFLGFSPSLTYSFTQAKSSLTLYDNSRHRLRFALARYF